jgi:hypothetical protein
MRQGGPNLARRDENEIGSSATDVHPGSRIDDDDTERSWLRTDRPHRSYPVTLRGRPFEARHLLCAGMYRACSTWQYEVLSHLVEHHYGGTRLGYCSGDAYQAIGQAGSRPGDSAFDAGWVVLKSHEGHPAFGLALRSRRAVAVYAYRDLRDVVFSLMYKRGESFLQLLRQGTIHQILANDRYWRSQPGVLLQRYESMIAEPVIAVIQLARHIGLAIPRREAMAIADEFSLESNRSRILAIRAQLERAGIDLESPGNQQIFDPVTLLHWNHLRPEGSPPWQQAATSQEHWLLDRICGGWLQRNGYPADRTSLTSTRQTGESSRRQRLTSRLQAELALARGRSIVVTRGLSERFPMLGAAVRSLVKTKTDEPRTLSTARPLEPRGSLNLAVTVPASDSRS